jgi:hypothetical protein
MRNETETSNRFSIIVVPVATEPVTKHMYIIVLGKSLIRVCQMEAKTNAEPAAVAICGAQSHTLYVPAGGRLMAGDGANDEFKELLNRKCCTVL